VLTHELKKISSIKYYKNKEWKITSPLKELFGFNFLKILHEKFLFYKFKSNKISILFKICDEAYSSVESSTNGRKAK
jgi:hypothetical protein